MPATARTAAAAPRAAKPALAPIPLVDLRCQYRALRGELEAAVLDALRSGQFILGPHVGRFEERFARYVGVGHFVACGSGTSAVALMLRAAGVRPGDEVVTTPLTFFGTVEGILLAGAVPVFADVDPVTLNLDARAAAAAVTPRTVAILPVHLYGQPADMDALAAVASKRRALLLEDAAQAAGSRYRGRGAGSLGRAAAFSFYPGKNLGAYGDGGGVATADDAIAAALRMLRDHGSDRKNHHLVPAGNDRMDTIQGAVLGVKLPRLEAWNRLRRRHAAAYRRALEGVPGISFVGQHAASESNCHAFVVRAGDRDGLLERLGRAGIMAGVHYPLPCHLQPALGRLRGRAGQFPEAERAAREVLSLPLYPELTAAQIRRVVESIRSFAGLSTTGASRRRTPPPGPAARP